jgi:hypothetical protein
MNDLFEQFAVAFCLLVCCKRLFIETFLLSEYLNNYTHFFHLPREHNHSSREKIRQS